jgi:hypothetical protein
VDIYAAGSREASQRSAIPATSCGILPQPPLRRSGSSPINFARREEFKPVQRLWFTNTLAERLKQTRNDKQSWGMYSLVLACFPTFSPSTPPLCMRAAIAFERRERLAINLPCRSPDLEKNVCALVNFYQFARSRGDISATSSEQGHLMSHTCA